MTSNAETRKTVCPDCQTRVEGGKVGCGRLFDEILARDFSDFRYARTHRLVVDAYSLQHPEKYMRSGKSFAAHLTGMAAALECEDPPSVNRSVQQWLNGPRSLDKPARIPIDRGDLNIGYVHSAADAQDHAQRVSEWARSVWEAWSEHHQLARDWIAQASR